MFKKNVLMMTLFFCVTFLLCADNLNNTFVRSDMSIGMIDGTNAVYLAQAVTASPYEGGQISLSKEGGQKSARTAMLMSAVIPGAGQMYLGKNTRAGAFLTADVLAFFAMFRFGKEKDIAEENYMMYAYTNAGLRKGAMPETYQLAQNYISSAEYNRSVERYARNRYLIILNDPDGYDWYMDRYSIPEAESWNWDNTFYQKEFNDIRSRRQNFEIYENFAVGALIINRIISTIDAALQTGKVNRNYQVYTVPDFDGRGISLIYEHKF